MGFLGCLSCCAVGSIHEPHLHYGFLRDQRKLRAECKTHRVVVGLTVHHSSKTGALIIRIGFWGPLYYNYDREPPKPYSNHSGPFKHRAPSDQRPLSLRVPDVRLRHVEGRYDRYEGPKPQKPEPSSLALNPKTLNPTP